MSNHFDYIVLGAGYAGLTAAALLAKHKRSTLLLESHYAVGGCASFFRRKHFFFDSGATTLSGMLPHLPLGLLQKELDIQFAVAHLPIGMIIKTEHGDIHRYANRVQWLQECMKVFPHKNQERFWSKLYELEEKVWKIVGNNPFFPPANIIDFLSLIAPKNFPNITIIRGVFSSLYQLLRRYNLHNDKYFKRFVDEQLIISTQNYSEQAPYLTSAMGLTYPSQTYYPYGGIAKPAQMIAEKFDQMNGVLRKNDAVVSIRYHNAIWHIETEKGKKFVSPTIISSIPIWNMVKLTHEKVQEYYRKKAEQFHFAWGAFMVYFAIESSEELPTAYYQIHTQETIPHCASRSFFVTISLSDDEIKAPRGWKTVTISTHTHSQEWFNLSEEQYERNKQQTTDFIISVFNKEFPQLRHSNKEWISSATPRTFSHYTRRFSGFVGGIPHSTRQNFLTLPHNVTPFKGLYQIGDSAFPGQGTPSVVLAAMNVVQRL